MTARSRLVVALAGATLLLTAGHATALAAQLNRGPRECTGPRLMVPYIQAPDRKTASAADQQVRNWLHAKFNSKEMCIIDKDVVDSLLARSGYRLDTTLSWVEAKTAASSLAADEFLMLEVKPADKGYVFSGYLALGRDEKLRDRIPAPDPGPAMSDAARSLAASLAPVLKQLAPEKTCYVATRDEKYAEAEAAARAAITAYPQAEIARFCLANALLHGSKPVDEAIAVVRELEQRDRDNLLVITLGYQAYAKKNDMDQFAAYAARLIAADPTNAAVEDIIDQLVAAKRTDVMMPLLEKAIAADPENVKLLRIQFGVIYRGEHWKEAAARGEVLARADTASLSDTLYYRRMVSAYANDSQPQKVLEWLRRAVQKFPTNVFFVNGLAQEYASLGQLPNAIQIYVRLINIAPKTPELRLRIANAYNELGQTDSAFAWLHTAYQSGDNKAQIATVAASIGNKLFKAAQASNSVDDYKKVIPFVAFSDSADAGDGVAKFLNAYASITIAQTLAGTLQQNPSCDVAKEAMSWAEKVQPLISTGGGRYNQQAAVAIMTNLPKLTTEFLDPWMKAKKCTQ